MAKAKHFLEQLRNDNHLKRQFAKLAPLIPLSVFKPSAVFAEGLKPRDGEGVNVFGDFMELGNQFKQID